MKTLFLIFIFIYLNHLAACIMFMISSYEFNYGESHNNIVNLFSSISLMIYWFIVHIFWFFGGRKTAFILPRSYKSLHKFLILGLRHKLITKRRHNSPIIERARVSSILHHPLQGLFRHFGCWVHRSSEVQKNTAVWISIRSEFHFQTIKMNEILFNRIQFFVINLKIFLCFFSLMDNLFYSVHWFRNGWRAIIYQTISENEY